MFLNLLLAGLGLILFRNLYRLSHNYILARRIGLPIVVCPATWQNTLWMITITAIPSVRQLYKLPGLDWIRYSYLGWVMYDQYHAHEKYGPAFTIVGPVKNEIMVGDPKVIHDVMVKYKKWQKPRELYSVFALLGENVNSVPADEWGTHRRVINAGFNDGNMKIVWEASVKQTRQWLKDGERTITYKQLHDDTDTVSSNVLMRAGFGKDYDFAEKGLKDIKKGRSKSLAGALQFMTWNFLFAVGAKDIRLPAFVEPKKLKELRDAVVDLKSYSADILENRSGEFVEALIDANENERKDGKPNLTQGELYGNLFILQLAGFDTTSYALSWTLSEIAAHPECQDWIREQIVDGGYTENFPKANRCRAAMMETLRLYTASPSLPRYSSQTETLQIAGKQHVIPPNTIVSSNIPGSHTNPKIWGDDVVVWKPERWIEVVDGVETLKDFPGMLAWAAGPRNCPGKKFSQVETVAAITTILRDYRLEASENMEDVLRDFDFELTPKPNRPEAASIKFVKL